MIPEASKRVAMGRCIAAVREHYAHLTLDTVAARAGITVDLLMEIEAGAVDVPLDLLDRVVEATGNVMHINTYPRGRHCRAADKAASIIDHATPAERRHLLAILAREAGQWVGPDPDGADIYEADPRELVHIDDSADLPRVEPTA